MKFPRSTQQWCARVGSLFFHPSSPSMLEDCPRPGCKKKFKSPRAVSSHLNSRYSGKCFIWYNQPRRMESPSISPTPTELEACGEPPSSPESIGPMPWKRPWGKRRVRFLEDDDVEMRPRSPSPPPPSPPRVPVVAPPPQGERNSGPVPLPKFVKHPTAGQCFGYGPTILDNV